MTREISDKFEGAVTVRINGRIRKDAKYVLVDPENGNALSSSKYPKYLMRRAKELGKKVPVIIPLTGRKYLILCSYKAA